jgi:colanic acid/amylovoran biosynthesis protein
MRILVIGQVSVHWGRVEFGNIGNYYITRTAFRELHRVFPDAEIFTTFQMTEEFCNNERVNCLPMELFYNWDDNDLNRAYKELGIAEYYSQTKQLIETTPYIDEVLKSDLVIDFSGELWGDHAEPVGKNRFLVGLIKDRVAQLFNKKTVLLAGSQGPFSDAKTKEFAKIVFKNFSIVSNREAASYDLLKENGFDVSKVENFTDPAFLFEPKSDDEMFEVFKLENIKHEDKETVGYILCGFNMLEGPYDKEPRRDAEFIQFAESVEYIVNELGARVCLMSHQNGFDLPPNFKLINGRDFPYAKQLYDVVEKRGLVNMSDVLCISRPYIPVELKAIIKQFDMFVSGRIHGFVAAVSQNVPTVIINRGFGAKSHRNIGFARSVGLEEYIADPHSSSDLISKIDKCWKNKEELKLLLSKRIPEVKEKAHDCFNSLLKII